MKIRTYLIYFIIFILLINCIDSNKEKEKENKKIPKKVIIQDKKKIIYPEKNKEWFVEYVGRIYDRTNIQFYSEVYDEDNNKIEDIEVEYYSNGIKMDSCIFSNSIGGTYIITAKSGDAVSEPIEVKVLETVKIKDEKLVELILSSNGIRSDFVLKDDLKRIEIVYLNNVDVKTLEGIEKLTELKKIEFSYVDVTKIESINSIYKLRNLEILAFSRIENDNLEFLDLNKLSQLETLKEIRAINMELEKIENLSILTSLEEIYIVNSKLENLDFLVGLKNIKSVSVIKSKINNISAIENLLNLESLYLSNNLIANISYIKNLKNLKEIILSFNRIENINVLSNFEKITYLDLSENLLTNIEALENVKITDFLSISNNKIKNLKGIEKSVNLKELFFQDYLESLVDRTIVSLEPLRGMKKMEYILLGGQFIEDLRPIMHFENCIIDLPYYENEKDERIDQALWFLEQNGCIFRAH